MTNQNKKEKLKPREHRWCSACQEMFNKNGEKTVCCECSGHQCQSPKKEKCLKCGLEKWGNSGFGNLRLGESFSFEDFKGDKFCKCHTPSQDMKEKISNLSGACQEDRHKCCAYGDCQCSCHIPPPKSSSWEECGKLTNNGIKEWHCLITRPCIKHETQQETAAFIQSRILSERADERGLVLNELLEKMPKENRGWAGGNKDFTYYQQGFNLALSEVKKIISELKE